jgi:heavy metal sensor kinase
LLAASAGGYWMSRRALAPVDEVTDAARLIGLQNLSVRLPVPHTGDELQRLSETWNRMLERLDSAVDRIQRFTADASHELRTPVSVIRTTAELALRRERDPEQYRKALRQILAETERMTRLTEDLLLLARSDAREFKLRLAPMDWNDLARQVVEENRPIADARGIRLTSHPAPDAAIVLGDEPALCRLLTMLVDNALKHTPIAGAIDVAISSDRRRTIVTVRDTGEGIDPADLPHIFDRFYRGDKARNHETGVGLGLAIAQSVAEMHSARIEVASEVGRGATFTVTFASLPPDEYQDEAARTDSASRRMAANSSALRENP